MTAKAKLAQKRLTLLQLAEKLGNVSKACQMHKVSRSQFYEYKRAFQQHGLDGLIDKPPIPGSHPNELTDETKQKIIDLSLKHHFLWYVLKPVPVCNDCIRCLWINLAA